MNNGMACPTCGAAVPPGAMSCPECGEQMGGMGPGMGQQPMGGPGMGQQPTGQGPEMFGQQPMGGPGMGQPMGGPGMGQPPAQGGGNKMLMILGILGLVGGIVLAAIGAGADAMGIGSYDGFGWKQMAGVGAGVAGLVVGLILMIIGMKKAPQQQPMMQQYA